uniref:Uncharacterized protein n=1 Tax=Avena sativa TaxID=4498 RepID=A0ACD5XIL2_AVESA
MERMVESNMPFQLLQEITDGFSKDRELGCGAYGKVYMGLHKDGTKVAVKLLHDMTGIDDNQFMNEFNNLKRLQHKNIVRLVGCCNETEELSVFYMGKLVIAEKRYRALCLEYMQNGTLSKYISDEYNGHDWPTRYTIIKGICEGLMYLHEELDPPIYHLDLKPDNILLGENTVPKIADFGISRLLGEERTRITKSKVGTFGYAPQEFIDAGVISIKFDIFSLGVIIIKMMAGETGYSKTADISSQQFIELVHGNWVNRLQETSVRATELYSEQVKTCIEIAMRCVKADRRKRPSIGDIVNELNEKEAMIREASLVGAAMAALKSVMQKLSCLLDDQYMISNGVHTEIKLIIDVLANQHAFLLEVSEEDPNVQVKAWMKEMQKLCYDIENSIDQFMTHDGDKSAKLYAFMEKMKELVG